MLVCAAHLLFLLHVLGSYPEDILLFVSGRPEVNAAAFQALRDGCWTRALALVVLTLLLDKMRRS